MAAALTTPITPIALTTPTIPAIPTGSARLRRGWTLALASLGVFMSALDVMVVSTALLTLRAQFGVSLPDLEWTIDASSPNAVTSSVPAGDVGIAAGTNNALNPLDDAGRAGTQPTSSLP